MIGCGHNDDTFASDGFQEMVAEQFHSIQLRLFREHASIVAALKQRILDLGGEVPGGIQKMGTSRTRTWRGPHGSDLARQESSEDTIKVEKSVMFGKSRNPTWRSNHRSDLAREESFESNIKVSKSVNAKLFGASRSKKKQHTWCAENFPIRTDASQATSVGSAQTFSKQDSFHLWPDWEVPIDYRAMNLKRKEDMEHIQRKRSVVIERSMVDDSPMATVNDMVVLHKSKCSFSPLSVPLLMWQAFGTIILIYDLGYITLQVFEPPLTQFIDIMSVVILWYWTFDIILTFFIGYLKDDGELVMESYSIAKHYLMHWFSVDLLLVLADWLTVGFIMFGSSEPNALDSLGLARVSKFARATRIIRLLRIVRLRKLKDLVVFAEDFVGSEYIAILLSLVRNVFAIIVITHCLACLWYWIGIVGEEAGEKGAWIKRYDLLGRPWGTRYSISLHWSITQFTPGASALQPETDRERLFCICVLLFALVAFSMFVSSATNQVTRLFSLQSTQNRQLWTLKKYLHQQSVSRELSMRVLRYVKIALGSRRMKVQAHDVQLLNLLSNPLREELETQSLMRAILVHPLFMVFSRRSGHVMRRICKQCIMEIALSKHDMLFGIGESAHAMFFVSHGVLSYMAWKHEHDPSVLIRQMHWCCEAVLWTPWVHRGDLQADVDCLLVGLDAAKFRNITSQHHMDRSFVTAYARAFVSTLNEHARDESVEITDLQAHFIECGDMARVLAWHRFGPVEGTDSVEIDAAPDDEADNFVQSMPSRNPSGLDGVIANVASNVSTECVATSAFGSPSRNIGPLVCEYDSSAQIGDVGAYPTEEQSEKTVVL